MELKDFDVTQINKDTKVVVFRMPVSLYMGDDGSIDYINGLCLEIIGKLEKNGITALFIDDSIQVEPLTDELISTGQLKTI